jgi:hypothetical protein
LTGPVTPPSLSLAIHYTYSSIAGRYESAVDTATSNNSRTDHNVNRTRYEDTRNNVRVKVTCELITSTNMFKLGMSVDTSEYGMTKDY